MNKPVKLYPDGAIKDLNRYVISLGYELSDRAEFLFKLTEEFAFSLNIYPLFSWFFLIQALNTTKRLQIAVTDLGGNPLAGAMSIVEKLDTNKTRYDPYDLYFEMDREYWRKPYSHMIDRTNPREIIIDFAIVFARRNQRAVISEMDVVEAILACGYQEVSQENKRSIWVDERLDTPYITLAHIAGLYSESLWVKVDEIRERLGFFESDTYRKFPEIIAPPNIRPAILSFLNDYPDYYKNCFLIMPFRNTTAHNDVKRVLKETLARYDLNLIRADEKNYSDDLLSNVETYIYGCSSAIAVIEQISDNYYNPNVALEVGYFYGLKKPVCLLKEKGVKTLHSDLIGKLYIEFDAQDIEGTIPEKIIYWLINKGLVSSISSKSNKN